MLKPTPGAQPPDQRHLLPRGPLAPRLRTMISFWISVVPPKLDWTRLSRQSSQSWRRAADWCSRRSRRAPSGQREPRRSPGASWAAITRRGSSRHAQPPGPRRGPDDDAEPAAADIPAADVDVDAGEPIAAQLPQILAMHDARDSRQMGSCSRGPPRGNQDLSRGQDDHHPLTGCRPQHAAGCGTSSTTAPA